MLRARQRDHPTREKRYAPSVKILAHGFPVPVFALLLATALASRGPASILFAGDVHANIHHHDGSLHPHGHSHLESEGTPSDCGSHDFPCAGDCFDEDHCCCHGHHHDCGIGSDALYARERDSVPTPATIASSADANRLWRMSRMSRAQRHFRPHTRGRPPDYLIQLRTVVLLT